MLSPRRLVLPAVLLGLLAGAAGARIIEIDPFSAGDLTTDWTVVADDYEPFTYSDGVLEGKAKSFKPGEVRYNGGRWPAFKLFFQLGKRPRSAAILLIPAEGEPVEIEIDKGWADRRDEWTQCVLEVGGGKAVLKSKDEEAGTFEVPEGEYGIGFRLAKGGKVSLNRIRVVWDKPPEPKAEIEPGFLDLLTRPGGLDEAFRAYTDPNGKSVPGTWVIEDGMLRITNPEEEAFSQKFTARISPFRLPDYVLKFKVKSGAKNLNLVAHLGVQGQQGSAIQWTLDGYLTGGGPWHAFVVTFQDGKLSLNVNGLDVIPAAPAPAAPTGLAWLIGPSGHAEIKDLHIKSSQIRAPTRPAGDAGGASAGSGEPPPFFNGKDLEAWAGQPDDTWKVVSGAIFCAHPGPNLASLVWRYRLRGDYTVTFSAELGTTGFSLLTKHKPDEKKHSQIAVPAGALKQAWNECKLVVSGTTATLFVNGTEVGKAAALDGAGFFGFLVSPGGACRLKDLKLSES